jgi:carboxyl-terminal processing protease
MYRKYPIAVLINGVTASAAELFTGTLKAYGLATVVGENTFGKGCVQTTYPLYYADGTICGAIKMTTTFYSPFGMENYHGIGIAPTDGYKVSLSETAKKYNIYKLMYPEYQYLDDQLSLAITAIAGK